MDIGWRCQWAINHDDVRRSLRGLKDLRRLALCRDSYPSEFVGGDSEVQEYYSAQNEYPDKSLLRKRPELDQQMNWFGGVRRRQVEANARYTEERLAADSESDEDMPDEPELANDVGDLSDADNGEIEDSADEYVGDGHASVESNAEDEVDEDEEENEDQEDEDQEENDDDEEDEEVEFHSNEERSELRHSDEYDQLPYRK